MSPSPDVGMVARRCSPGRAGRATAAARLRNPPSSGISRENLTLFSNFAMDRSDCYGVLCLAVRGLDRLAVELAGMAVAPDGTIALGQSLLAENDRRFVNGYAPVLTGLVRTCPVLAGFVRTVALGRLMLLVHMIAFGESQSLEAARTPYANLWAE